MAIKTEDVVIRITSETVGVKKTTDTLIKQGKVEKENVKIFEEAAKKRQFLLDRGIERLKKLEIQRQKAFNPKDIRRFDDRIKETTADIKLLGGQIDDVDKKTGKFSTEVGKIGKIIIGAFAVGTIINFTKHIFELAVESEAFRKRAKTVFKESAEFVEEFAEKNAESLGLTIDGFLGAAAAIGDILVPLGISRRRAAEMSTELTRLGGALKEFSGDSRSAADISNIVARALTGEVEGLKTLGLVVDQTSQEFKDLIKQKIVDEGLTRQQAKAEAIFQTAIEGSADALAQFETNTDSLARQEAVFQAQSAELADSLAHILTPAFISVTEVANGFLKSLRNGTFVTTVFDKATEKTTAQLEEARKVYIGVREAQGLAIDENVLFIFEQQILAARMRETTDAGVKLSEQSLEGAAAMKRVIEVWREAKRASEELKKSHEVRIKTIGELKEELKLLRLAQDSLIPGSEALLINQTRVKEIQAILKTGVEKSLGPFAQLAKRVSDLKKELKDQSVEGNISKDTIKDLNDAIDDLTDAEVDLQLALAGTLPFMKAQKLALEDVSKGAKTADELLKGFTKDQEEDARRRKKTEEEALRKRLDNIDRVSQAEQQAFNILAQLNINRLIAIDNQESAQLKALESQGLGEEQLAARRLEIQQKSDEERARILTKQAKADKLAAIFEATIAGAIGVIRALAVPPAPNLLLGGIMAALGAVELAVIAAQPIPTFHEGKKSELKPGEMNAVILKKESVIPPKQSVQHKGIIDSIIDDNLKDYVFKHYQLPILKEMGRESRGFDDYNITSKQSKTNRLLTENNTLTRNMIKALDSGSRRRSWR